VHSTVMAIMRSHAPFPELSTRLRALWRVAVLVHDLPVEGLNSWLSASVLETLFEQIEQRCRAEIELPRGMAPLSGPPWARTSPAHGSS
jgi:hypothetical protein